MKISCIVRSLVTNHTEFDSGQDSREDSLIIIVEDNLVGFGLLEVPQSSNSCTSVLLLTAKLCWNIALKKPLCFASFDLGIDLMKMMSRLPASR